MNAPGVSPGLSQAVGIAASVVERVRALVPDDDPDFSLLIDTETDVPEKLCRLLRIARLEEAEAKGIKTLMEDLSFRKQRKESKADRLRGIVAWALRTMALTRLDAPDFTATLRPGKPRLEIEDDSQIPSQLRRPGPPDLTAIRKALKAGETIPGARLADTADDILTIRNT